MVKVIGKTRYRVKGSTLLAHNHYWDGQNHTRHGRNTFLYRSAKGHYFVVYMSQWQGEHNRIEPLSKEEAYELYEHLRVKEVEPEEAFPGIQIEEA
jgi:hypothetical protein